MRVNNTTILLGDNIFRQRKGEVPGKNKKADGKTFDGSSLNKLVDPISARKSAAQKRAMKIMGNAMKSDLKVDTDLDERRARVNKLRENRKELLNNVSDIDKKREALKGTYGVEDGSEEAEGLSLLEKELESKQPFSTVKLTEEDKEALKKLKEEGISEYQERSIKLLESKKKYLSQIEDIDDEISFENQVISDTEQERLKFNPMADAKRQAESIMDAASDQVKSFLYDEAKSFIDEQLDENRKKAEDIKEEKEKLQERIDAVKEKKEEQEEFTEKILEGVQVAAINETDLTTAQEEIKTMINKLKLIEDDIKGAAVDKVL